MSEAHNLPSSAQRPFSAAELARFIVSLEVGPRVYAKRLRYLGKLEDSALDVLAEAVDRSNVYPLHSRLRPTQMDDVRVKASALARATLVAVKVVRDQVRDGTIGAWPR